MKTNFILSCLFFAFISARQDAGLDGFFVRKTGDNTWQGAPESNQRAIFVGMEGHKVVGDSVIIVLHLTGESKADFRQCSIIALSRKKTDESKFISAGLIGKYPYETEIALTIDIKTEYLLFYSNNKNSPVLNVQELIGR